MKIANIRGELTDISAKKEALVHLVCEIHLPIHPKLCYVTLSLKWWNPEFWLQLLWSRKDGLQMMKNINFPGDLIDISA